MCWYFLVDFFIVKRFLSGRLKQVFSLYLPTAGQKDLSYPYPNTRKKSFLLIIALKDFNNGGYVTTYGVLFILLLLSLLFILKLENSIFLISKLVRSR